MPTSLFAQKGFAVLLAIFSIVLFGALATAMAFAAGQETRASGGVFQSAHSLSAAEGGVWEAVATADWMVAMTMRPGQVIRQRAAVGTPAAAAIAIVRLDSTCFFIQSISPDPEAEGGNSRVIRRVGLTIEVLPDSGGVLRPSRVPNRAWMELF